MSLNGQIPIFVINLDRRPDRLARMAEQLDAMGLEWERVTALDAQTVTDEELEPIVAIDQMRHAVFRGAMCLVRRNADMMQRVVDEGHAGAIILQDDVELSPDLAIVARDPDWVPARYGLVQMELWHRGSGTKLVEPGEATAIPGRLVHRLHSKAMGSACFYVSAAGARTYLSQGLPARASSDHSLFNPAFAPAFDAMGTGILNPAIGKQARDELGTDIGGGKPAAPSNRARKRRTLLFSPGRLHRKLRKEIPSAMRLPTEAWLRMSGRATRIPVTCRLDALADGKTAR